MGREIKQLAEDLESLMAKGEEWIRNCDEILISQKPSILRWSKKEILGHLIDSAVNNLRRFTEIQFEAKPYSIVSYNQDELVKVNDYQNAHIEELLGLWKSLNRRIAILISSQTPEALSYEVRFRDGSSKDLRFIMTDYVSHLSHHLDQIMAD